MRIVQEVKVECVTQQEYDALLDWVENQFECTMEFNVVGKRGVEQRTVSLIPYMDPPAGRFESFCTALQRFVDGKG